MRPLVGCETTTAGANGERRTERRMRATSVGSPTPASFANRLSWVVPASVGLQRPCAPVVPSAPGSASTTTCPAVPASGRPFASTIAPRGAVRSTTRNDCEFAIAVYCGPCRIWIDQARRTSTPMSTPTSTASPPIRTKKPGLRKYGASAREYGWGRLRSGRLRGSLTLRRSSGVEVAILLGSSSWFGPEAQCTGRYGSSSASSSASSASAYVRQASSGSSRSVASMAVTVGSPAASSGQLLEGRGQRGAAVRQVELGGEPFDGDVAERELAVRISAGGEDEHRATPRRLQLRVVHRHRVEHEPDEHRGQLLGREPGLVELL